MRHSLPGAPTVQVMTAGGPQQGDGKTSILRVAIADSQAMFARSLEMVLGPSSGGRIEVVGTAGTVGEALQVLARTEPEVVLVDLELAPPGSIELVNQCRQRFPGLRVLTLSKAEDFELARDALASGAEAFLSKAARPEQLLAPLLAVLQGWQVLSPPMLEYLIDHARRPGAEVLETLSDEERNLWVLAATGFEVTAIAERLYVSERTAKRLLADLRDRLGVRSRSEMAALAGRVGLLDDVELGGRVAPPAAEQAARGPGA
jgi:DNA-binding NarL/FixJ family response regulator